MATILSLAPLVTLALVGLILFRQRTHSMKLQDIQDAIGRIDAATTAVGAELTDISSKLAAAQASGVGITQADVDDITAKLNAEADKLTALASPTDPNAAPILAASTAAPATTSDSTGTTGG